MFDWQFKQENSPENAVQYVFSRKQKNRLVLTSQPFIIYVKVFWGLLLPTAPSRLWKKESKLTSKYFICTNLILIIETDLNFEFKNTFYQILIQKRFTVLYIMKNIFNKMNSQSLYKYWSWWNILPFVQNVFSMFILHFLTSSFLSFILLKWKKVKPHQRKCLIV